MTPERRALLRHRQRARPQTLLAKAIIAIDTLPPVFSDGELNIIRTRFAALMMTWLDRADFEVHYER